jgi:hypothetical protein
MKHPAAGPGTLTLTTPSEREIVLTRVFDAPRHLVFDAFTKPELIRRHSEPAIPAPAPPRLVLSAIEHPRARRGDHGRRATRAGASRMAEPHSSAVPIRPHSPLANTTARVAEGDRA